jgi:hypothetical protein
MATNLAVIVFCIFLIRGIIFIVQKLKSGETVADVDQKTWLLYLFCFVSGVLFANAVPHFVHGISGEDFPAPLGQYLGQGFLHNLANVIWGWVKCAMMQSKRSIAELKMR